MSLILEALRKSEHERHGAADSVLPLIVKPRAGRARKRRVSWLPLLILLLVVSAAAVTFAFRETLFPSRTAAMKPAAPSAARVEPSPEAVQRRQQPRKETLKPTTPARQPVIPAATPSTAVAEPTPGAERRMPPASKPEANAQQTESEAVISKPAPGTQRKPAPRPAAAPVVAAKEEPKPEPKPKPKPKPKSVSRDAAPAALSTFPADFIRQVQPLHLDFHVYSPDSSRRMVYINNREYEEGDHLKNNLKILRIVPLGAVMQWKQQTFLLTARD
ncbi:MAG: general secretion pathway protein GspB [Pseudomonadota bacterium]